VADEDLLHRWSALLAPHSARPVDIEVAGRAVVARYAEPRRRYHTVEHLTEVLAALDGLLDLASDPLSVELAAWFHDAVYDPAAHGGANEHASAELASQVLNDLGVDDERITEVARLIEMTAGHAAESGDTNGAVLADADLAILHAHPDRYARYAVDVRAEYAHVDDDAWRAGRSALLTGFLARPRLFATDRVHVAFDDAARRNLGWELVTLAG
jgi:predicted metal-dependent HD superfamily phosphohydrolase